MPALYSHTSRAIGTTLTAAIYNGDHENHITNGVPAQLDDYSVNTTQMQATTDPGEVGTESLPTSLAGEIERLRFIIKELSGSAQWYASPTPQAWRLIEERAPLATNAIKFVTGINSTYDHYVFMFNNVRPATAQNRVAARVSVDGGTTYSSASSYTVHLIDQRVGTAALATNFSDSRHHRLNMTIARVMNTPGSGLDGYLYLHSPSSTTLYKKFQGEVGYFGSTSMVMRRTHIAGAYLGTTATGSAKKAVNAVKFMLDSGSWVATGRIALYGLRRSL